MPEAGPASLLDRRLVIVTGKGGTGKTTVAAALALAAARAGRRVLLAEVARDEALVRLLAPDPAPAGYAGREVQPRLRVMQIDPFEALAEYLGLQLGVPALVRRVLRNRGFRQLMAASPGWRELIALGKLWHLEQMEEAPGRPLYDLLVVDAPATGHSVAFLERASRGGLGAAHRAAAEALAAGGGDAGGPGPHAPAAGRAGRGAADPGDRRARGPRPRGGRHRRGPHRGQRRRATSFPRRARRARRATEAPAARSRASAPCPRRGPWRTARASCARATS